MNPKDLDQRVTKPEANKSDQDSRVALFWQKDWPELRSNIDSIQHSVEKMTDVMREMQITQAQQQASIDRHIRRTDLAEASLAQHREESLAARNRIAAKLKPVTTHVTMIQGVLKFFGLIGMVVGIAVGILKLLAFI